VDIIDELYGGLSTQERQAALQYGPTSGYPPLLESLTAYLASRGIPLSGQELLITSGGQQAINLVSKVLIDPGDLVVTENPSFIGALAAFMSYQAHLVGIPLDEEGISIPGLQKVIEERCAQIKMLYLNPIFQNPSGIMYSEARKKALLEKLSRQSFYIIEDDPYGELYFDDRDRPRITPLKAMAAPDFPICYIGSFAKIFGPGFRLGWLLGPREIVEKCELAKQSMFVHAFAGSRACVPVKGKTAGVPEGHPPRLPPQSRYHARNAGRFHAQGRDLDGTARRVLHMGHASRIDERYRSIRRSDKKAGRIRDRQCVRPYGR
jgi:2-aminoadipate transaminase